MFGGCGFGCLLVGCGGGLWGFWVFVGWGGGCVGLTTDRDLRGDECPVSWLQRSLRQATHVFKRAEDCTHVGPVSACWL